VSLVVFVPPFGNASGVLVAALTLGNIKISMVDCLFLLRGCGGAGVYVEQKLRMNGFTTKFMVPSGVN
jgi:hypothetical protein